MVAKIAQFIYIAEVNGDDIGFTLMALSVVVGREVARVIRREYLRNNLDYLEYFMAIAVFDFKEKKLHPTLPRKNITNSLSALKSAMEQWIEVNEWWKVACRDAVLFAKGGKKMGTDYPQICKMVVLPDFANDIERQQFDEKIEYGPSSQVDFYYWDDFVAKDFTVVLAVDNVDLKGMEQERIEELLLNKGNKTLRVMISAFAHIFFNPAMTIDLGLVDVFKFQVEELQLDVNCQDYIGLFFDAPVDSPDDKSYCVPLILHALVQPDQLFLEHLLSIHSFDVNPVMECNLDGEDILDWNQTLFHDLSQILLHKWLPLEIHLDRIKYILQQKDVSLEVLNARGCAPLAVLCDRSRGTACELDLAKIFLSHGAQVTVIALRLAAQNDRNLYNLLHLYNNCCRRCRF